MTYLPLLLSSLFFIYHLHLSTSSDEVFGTAGDPGNLKSGLEECSSNKLTVLPGIGDSNEVATGVIEVTIGISINGRVAALSKPLSQLQSMPSSVLPCLARMITSSFLWRTAMEAVVAMLRMHTSTVGTATMLRITTDFLEYLCTR